MSTVINTNIAATRTHNVYNRNNDYMNQALSRVATGMKVNSAKDNASTWAISEKMRERIRANDQANQNVQNDTALLKTAEGGISNTIDILKTLKERAVNAANDSNMNTDRSVIAEEVRQLVKQIDDNAGKVKFNGRTLLKGTAGTDTAATLSTDPDAAAAAAGGAAAATPTPTPLSHTVYNSSLSDLKDNSDAAATYATKWTQLTTDGSTTLISGTDKLVFSAGGTELGSFAVGSGNINALTATQIGTSGVTVGYFANGAEIKDYEGNNVYDSNGDKLTASADGLYVIGKGSTALGAITVAVTDSSNSSKDSATTALASLFNSTAVQEANVPTTASSSQLTFHIGGEQDFSINMTLNDMTSTGSILNLGSDFAEKFLNATDAKVAIGTIDNALNAALKEQTRIGAYENRLGYTSDNLTTMNENLEAADSVMRDSDIAKEMTQYMKYSVLAQASQYMLAQAGQNAFSVLNLLQA